MMTRTRLDRAPTRALPIVIACLGATAPAHAQEAGVTLEEITVTARKTAENVQDVPLAVSAFTSEALERSNIERFDDFRTRLPNLHYEEFNLGSPTFYIRGIGSGGAVGIFADEVYVSELGGATGDFLDLERVEVLRGPQGTLFGRNVVGGAIAMHSKRPTRDAQWQASINAGNHERLDAEAVLSGPLSERVSGRIAASRKSYGGHSFNTLTGHHLDDQDRVAARASLLFEPTDTLEVLWRAEYGRDDARGQWWDLAVEGPFSTGNGNSDPRRGENPEDGFNRRKDWNTTLTINWDAPVGTLTSISAYRDSEFHSRENTTGLVVLDLTDPARFGRHHTLFVQEEEQQARQYTQEIRWAVQPTDQLDLVTGVYYLDDDVDSLPIVDYRFVFFDSEGRYGYDVGTRTRSYAAFGQLQYSPSDRWQLTGGVRWTHDEKTVESQTLGQHFVGFGDQGAGVAEWAVDVQSDWAEVTPMASLSFHPNDDVHLFATVSRGFKSGGFDATNPERAAAQTAFNPEYAWDYELGIKSELLGRRLRLNANLFFVDYTDLQVTLIRQPDPNFPPFGVIGNAGKAEIKGVEMDWEYLVTSSLSFYGAYAYNDNEVRDLELDGIDISGNRLPYTPESKLSAGLAYTLRTTVGSWTARGDFAYVDEQFTELGNSDVVRIEPYELVDAALTWQSPSGKIRVELWGKNLSDELYWTTASEVPVRDAYVKYGAPRSYGLSFTVYGE